MNNPWNLTRRQVQLMQLLAEGCTNEEIAQRLALSEHTVKVHFYRLFPRMQVTNRTHAALLWDRANRQEVA